MKTNKSFNFRIYPNIEQKILLAKTFGCCRVYYNTLLNQHNNYYSENKTTKGLKRTTEKELKNTLVWLKEVDSIAIQQSRRNLDNAFKNFFDSCKGKRKGRKVGFPKFKSKKDKQSYRTISVNNNIQINFDDNKIKLPKIGWIKYSDNRIFNSQISSVTISKNKSNQYFASILTEIEIPDEKISTVKNIFAADMSCSDFLVSEQEKFTNPKSYRLHQKKLSKLQRKVSKKVLGSFNRKKANFKVARLHNKIRNFKNNYLHQVSHYLVNKYDAIVLEDLNIEGMKRFGVGKSVANDFSFSTFTNMIKYKCDWSGKHFVQVNRFFPSSKLCNNCGYINDDLQLSERKWVCESCDNLIDRDINAARNIFREGESILINTLGINLIKNSTSGIEESYVCGGNDHCFDNVSNNIILNKSLPMKQESTAFRP